MSLLRTHSEGKDAFGRFRIRIPEEEAPLCVGCKGDVDLAVQYYLSDFRLPEDIKASKTILGNPRAMLGINCGCYGKFHRQVAHIQDKMQHSNGDKLPPKTIRDK